MEIGVAGAKDMKYNHTAPIDLDTIPFEDKEQALIEFAEGSLGLEMCLRVMWDNNLKTHACCAGEQDEYDIAYIAMSQGVDVFSFLSDELLDNDMVVLELENDRQTIRFAGLGDDKEHLMEKFARDISSGRKDNNFLVESKIGKNFPDEWLKQARIHDMVELGMTDEEIMFRERGIELEKILSYGTQEEIDAIMPEYVERVGLLNQRLLDREKETKKDKVY